MLNYLCWGIGKTRVNSQRVEVGAASHAHMEAPGLLFDTEILIEDFKRASRHYYDFKSESLPIQR